MDWRSIGITLTRLQLYSLHPKQIEKPKISPLLACTTLPSIQTSTAAHRTLHILSPIHHLFLAHFNQIKFGPRGPRNLLRYVLCSDTIPFSFFNIFGVSSFGNGIFGVSSFGNSPYLNLTCSHLTPSLWYHTDLPIPPHYNITSTLPSTHPTYTSVLPLHPPIGIYSTIPTQFINPTLPLFIHFRFVSHTSFISPVFFSSYIDWDRLSS